MEKLEKWKCSETYKEVIDILGSHLATMMRNPNDLPPIEIYKPNKKELK